MNSGEVCLTDCGNGSGADIARMCGRHRRLVLSGRVEGYGSGILSTLTIHLFPGKNGLIMVCHVDRLSQDILCIQICTSRLPYLEPIVYRTNRLWSDRYQVFKRPLIKFCLQPHYHVLPDIIGVWSKGKGRGGNESCLKYVHQGKYLYFTITHR